MLSEVLHAVTVNLIAMVLCFLYISAIFKVSQKLFKDSYDFQKAWEKDINAIPPKGLYGKVVMRHVKKDLTKQYSEFPKVGDLLRAKTTGKMFIVTHCHIPQPLTPHGYIDLQRMDDGHHEYFRVSLQEFYPPSYEKMSDENNQER